MLGVNHDNLTDVRDFLVWNPSREDVTARPVVVPTTELHARPGRTLARSVKHMVVRLVLACANLDCCGYQKIIRSHASFSHIFLDCMCFELLSVFVCLCLSLCSLSGDLVVIPDAEKNAEVTAFLQSFDDYDSCSGPYPWIGGHNCQGSACEWVDGTN